MHIRAFKEPYRSPGISLFLEEIRGQEVYYVVPHSLVLEKIGSIWEEAAPTTRINPTDAQVLMDDLWNCGLRPSEGTGSAGQLAATQKHLEDMRTLVFKKDES